MNCYGMVWYVVCGPATSVVSSDGNIVLWTDTRMWFTGDQIWKILPDQKHGLLMAD